MTQGRIHILVIGLVFMTSLGCLAASGTELESTEEPFEVVAPEVSQMRGDRLFGINVSESREGFESSFAVAQEAGIQVIELNIPWDVIEVSQGEYQDPWGVLEAISFYGYNDVDVCLSLAVIDTVERATPDYLDGLPYNSTQVIGAFQDMVDWVMTQVPSNVTIPSISVGNEIDLILSGDEWDEYAEFYQFTAEHLHRHYPDVKVGVKTTVMNGVLGDELDQVQAINEYSDVIMLTYYPQDGAFQVLEPTVVHGHFGRLVEVFPNRPIWLMELGYQSGGEHCHSSEGNQAMFYHEMFAAWDVYADQIEFVLIDWLHDQTPEQIEEWEEYYGSSAPSFVEYLSTLDLRNHDGTDKKAWQQVLVETEARGW
ncbi:MAG: hypothetical protein GY832_13575 [Chloroflexi bacterium]|nr:hypothetical protein [Chloroflexota bacterium]